MGRSQAMSDRGKMKVGPYDPLHIGWPLWVVAGSSLLFLLAPVLLLIPMSFGSAEIIEFPPSKVTDDNNT